MDSELNALEDRIRQAVALCKQLRADNIDLRQRLAQLENDNRRLAIKVADASQQLEGLIKRLPEEAA